MSWNPDCYHRFQSERSAPFDDLCRLVEVRENLRVIDLGCGTGELTRRLADMLPGSDVLGVDSSAEMLERAAEQARPGLRFEQREIERVKGTYDLVFSNAAIHWVDQHEVFVGRLFDLLEPGGQLAIQLPSNHDHPSQLFIREIATEDPFPIALRGFNREPAVLAVEEYAELLFHYGASDIVAFEKVYPHVLANADAVADWTSGTTLVPYMQRLSLDMQQLFMARYRAALRREFPEAPVFFGFKRILFSAKRPIPVQTAE